MSNATDRATQIKALANQAADAADADIFVINSGIDGDLDRQVMRRVIARKRRPNVIVILVTEGGSADQAFRIARCFQACYTRFTVAVAGWCKSAGTLVCVGAHNLLIGDLGELGPLDVQIAKPDELGLIASGLTIDSSFRSLQSASFQMFESFLLDILAKSGGRITTKTAAELAVKITTGLFSPIFEQMDPIKIGEDYRSARIAEQYALRLSGHSQSFESPEEAVEDLVRGYPSHGFVIDRTEAENIFSDVKPIEGALLELVTLLGSLASEPRSSSRSQPAFFNYLNQEVKNGKPGSKQAPSAGPQPGGKAQGAGKSIPPDSEKGDGDITLPVADRSTGKGPPKSPAAGNSN